ncbi:MAG: hypothetical protein ACRC32_20870 [Chroococcidiopsis sp.]
MSDRSPEVTQLLSKKASQALSRISQPTTNPHVELPDQFSILFYKRDRSVWAIFPKIQNCSLLPAP